MHDMAIFCIRVIFSLKVVPDLLNATVGVPVELQQEVTALLTLLASNIWKNTVLQQWDQQPELVTREEKMHGIMVDHVSDMVQEVLRDVESDVQLRFRGTAVCIQYPWLCLCPAVLRWGFGAPWGTTLIAQVALQNITRRSLNLISTMGTCLKSDNVVHHWVQLLSWIVGCQTVNRHTLDLRMRFQVTSQTDEHVSEII